MFHVLNKMVICFKSELLESPQAPQNGSLWYSKYRSSHPGVFLGKGALKTCSKFTGEHPCENVISIKLLKCDFNKVAKQPY